MTGIFEIRTFETLSIGSSIMLTDSQLSSLCRLCRQPGKPANASLGGRTAVIDGRVEGIGPVIVKPYRRGGFMRHLSERHYLKIGPTRCQQEFELLQTAGHLGVNVPEPVAFVYCGRLYYVCWLITRSIPKSESLVRLAKTDVTAAQRVMPAVTGQIAKLIEHRIRHFDLHPGNVMVDKEGRAFIIDLDKGHIFKGSREKLRNLYLRRWQRAVNKHGLPQMLNEILRDSLAGNVHQTGAQ